MQFKYKVGDKVRVISKIAESDRYRNFKMENGDCKGWAMIKPMTDLVGKVVTIKELDKAQNCYHIDDTGLRWTDEMFEGLAVEKYKIGDRVIATDNIHKHCNAVGTVVGYWHNMNHPTPYDVRFDGDSVSLWSKIHSLAPTNDKIVITTDGKTTTATLYREDGGKEVATAKCCPEDTFDFNFGAKLAMERLMKKVEPVTEWRVVDRKPRVGDYIRITNPEYSFDNKGDIRKIDGVRDYDFVYIYQKNHPTSKSTVNPNFDWSYPKRMWELVEKVTNTEPKKPEPPKYFTGKVVCIKNTLNDGEFTVGKIYEIKDGDFTDNLGHIRPNTSGRNRVRKLSDLETGYYSDWYYKFIPIVE